MMAPNGVHFCGCLKPLAFQVRIVCVIERPRAFASHQQRNAQQAATD
jgi:hypothetical protein